MNFYELYRIINEYGENLINFLIEKFKKEEPALTTTVIRNYIERFERIKNNLPEKDITKYSWQDLENAVDSYQTKDKIKAGKVDVTVTDANLLYNQNGIRIYLGKDRKSCVKYGNGYTFCISARGTGNMYNYYRIEKRGTPYFIFNDNLPKEDPDHVLVIFVYNKPYYKRYSITNALNKGEKYYNFLKNDIIYYYPWTKPIENFVDDTDKGGVEVSNVEKLTNIVEKEIEEQKKVVSTKKSKTNTDVSYRLDFGVHRADFGPYITNMNPVNLKEFQENKNNVVFINIYLPEIGPSEGFFLDDQGSFSFYKNIDEILKIIKDKISYDFENWNYYESDSEIKEKIKEALKNKITDAEDQEKIINSYFSTVKYDRDDDIISHNEKSTISIKGELPREAYPNFFVKILNVNELFSKVLDENKEVIDDFNFHKTYNKKVLDLVKSMSEEKAKSMIDFLHKSNDSSKSIIRQIVEFM